MRDNTKVDLSAFLQTTQQVNVSQKVNVTTGLTASPEGCVLCVGWNFCFAAVVWSFIHFGWLSE